MYMVLCVFRSPEYVDFAISMKKRVFWGLGYIVVDCDMVHVTPVSRTHDAWQKTGLQPDAQLLHLDEILSIIGITLPIWMQCP